MGLVNLTLLSMKCNKNREMNKFNEFKDAGNLSLK